MTNIKEFVEYREKLDYSSICPALIEIFGVTEKVSWESVLPASQQQELFGGEVLRLISEHPNFAKQKDIRPITLKKGSISQMLFFYTTLNDSSLPKKQIQDVTKRFIKGIEANRYIIWFFGNRESTELKVVLSAKEGKRIVLKTLAFATNQPFYKTYSYILSEVQIKVSGLFVEPTDLWTALWRGFDLSIVNKRFYEEIKAAFDKLLLQIDGRPFTKDQDKVQFAIRLIGRIIFSWFLKRKGILRDEILSSQSVNNIKDKNYYHDRLEILFFDILNTPEKDRRAGLPKILTPYPFLNGGLFEAQVTDYKGDVRVQISNEWFHDFFANTLEKYNFTVDENSSSEAEIAIDPEMLGRIFENLLAEQNPETGESARKATGSFYTPREIVEYMVEQSLGEYLLTHLNVAEIPLAREEARQGDMFRNTAPRQLSLKAQEPKENISREDVDDFVHSNHWPDNFSEEKQKATRTLSALERLKIIDPACGSGAYPIGVLQKVIALKKELTVFLKRKPLTSADIYKLKLETISSSIFGVDIQPMAVELSRLRCWLSLVVEEELDNIKPLPNLDFKFVCANSLISVPEDEYVKVQSADALGKFGKLTEQYFSPSFSQKEKLKTEIKKSIIEVTKTHDRAIQQFIVQIRKEEKSATPSRIKLLRSRLEEYSQQQALWHSYENIFENKRVDFFNLDYFFPTAKEGFDIVIGNPPYIQLQKDGGDLARLYEKSKYETFERTGDIYSLFYERGWQLLKPNGCVCYITSNSWMRAGYGETTRRFLVEKTNPLLLVDFPELKLFESATVVTNILLFSRSKNLGKTMACTVTDKVLNNLSVFVRQHGAPNPFLDSGSWAILSPIEKRIKEKIQQTGVPLSEWDVNINYGVKTGLNDAFIIRGKAKDDLIELDPKSAEIIRPILRGRDIKRYSHQFADLWLIGTFPALRLSIDDYPSVKQHLIRFGYDRLKQTGEPGARKKTSNQWFETQDSISYWDDFSKQKIVWMELADDANFSLDSEGYFVNDTVFFLTGDRLPYLLAFLNSKLCQWFFSQIAGTSGVGTRRWKKQYVHQIRIPNSISKKDEELLGQLALKIQERKGTGGDVATLENQINQIIVGLFGLSRDEVDCIQQFDFATV